MHEGEEKEYEVKVINETPFECIKFDMIVEGGIAEVTKGIGGIPANGSAIAKVMVKVPDTVNVPISFLLRAEAVLRVI